MINTFHILLSQQWNRNITYEPQVKNGAIARRSSILVIYIFNMNKVGIPVKIPSLVIGHVSYDTNKITLIENPPR